MTALDHLLMRRSRLSQRKDRVRIQLAVLGEYDASDAWLAHYSAHLHRRYDDVIAEIRYQFPEYLEVVRVETTAFGDAEKSFVEGSPGPPS